MYARRERVDVFLSPGALVVRDDAVNIKTVLGSCIAVCLWDRTHRIGGMNHYLLPQPGAGDTPDLRYGTVSIPRLLDEIVRRGADPGKLEAAVIGGGRPMEHITIGAVGAANIALALDLLRRRGIRIVREETGGSRGRKVLFNVGSGHLLVRVLGPTRLPQPGILG